MRIPSWRRGVMALAGMASCFGCAATFTLQSMVHTELVLHPPHLPWSHTGPFVSLDHDSIRRGYQVYKQECSACHSNFQPQKPIKYNFYEYFKLFAYRNLVDICYIEDEPEEIQVEDEDNETGEKITLPGKLYD